MFQFIRLYGAIALSMVFWAFSFVWTKIAIVSFPPVTLVSSRLILAAILLFAYAKIARKFQTIRREDYKWFFLLAFFEPFLYYMGETYGLTRIDPTSAAVIIATIPLLAPVFGLIFLKERFSLNNMTGILLSLAGVILVIYMPGTGMNVDFWGVCLMFVAVFSAIFYAIALRKISMHYQTVNVIMYQSLFGVLFFLPVFLVVDFPTVQNIKISVESLQALIMLVIFASVLAFVFFAWAVRQMGIAKANVFVNLIPVFTALFSWLLLDQVLSSLQWFGVIIVVTGLFISQLNSKRKIRPEIEDVSKATV